MDPRSDANWWHFSIDPQQRGNRITDGPDGLRAVNPALSEDRHLLDYHTYIGLDQLLACQTPTSPIPDERIFITTHQFFELTFKQMIFDLGVVAATLAHLLAVPGEEEFIAICRGTDNAFWQPALTAAGRLEYSATTLLPVLTGFLSSAQNKSETFNSREFGRFRSNLQPASGFQSAQFRLIQRALGKGGLLGVHLFPAQEYWRNYEAAEDKGPARVVDAVILREDAIIAAPPPDSPLAPVAGLDDCAHRLMNRLAGPDKIEAGESGIASISHDDLDNAVADFQRILGAQRSLQEKGGTKPDDAGEKDRAAAELFRRDLESAIDAENARRAALHGARAGALRLRKMAAESHLALVLERIAATDRSLHGKQDESFLSLHFHMVAGRIGDLYEIARQSGEAEPPAGTGGGGVPYLGFMRMNLIPLFPALVAWRDTEG